MKGKYKVSDDFALRKDHTFNRSFPLGGYNQDGSVREVDKEHRMAGSVGRVCEVHDSPDIDKGQVWYLLDFGEANDLKISISENQLLELFAPLKDQR